MATPEPLEPPEDDLEPDPEIEPDAEPEQRLGLEADDDGEPIVPAGFSLCELCGGSGAVPDDLQRNPQTVTCETCHGYGKVSTGSRVPSRAVEDCPTCLGSGYMTRQAQPSYTPPPATTYEQPPPAYEPPPPPPYVPPPPPAYVPPPVPTG